MKKIIFIPLDERPCNYRFPSQIFNNDQFKVLIPPIEMMGNKKIPANIDEITKWLKEMTKDADGLVVSIDTLLYGGIIPSRLHNTRIEILEKRLEVLKDIKQVNPNLLIYGFQLIMRCPQYNSNDEEPDYYQQYGKSIFNYGYLSHLKDINKISLHQIDELNEIDIPKLYLDDFENRRKINANINCLCLDYVESKVIDFLHIPQDDSAEFGFTAIDQIKIRSIIKDKQLLNKVYMYPGADEAGSILMSRIFCTLHSMKPKVYIKYPAITSPTVIPSLEDRYLDTMVKYHIITGGGLVVDSLKECDAVLFINSASDKMLSSFGKLAPKRGMTVLRNVIEGMEFIDYAKKVLNKEIIIGDITYGNGSDIEIYQLLEAKNMLFDIAGFGGWNTASNSIGSTISQGFCYLKNKKTKQHLDFLVSRYIEDIGYCGYTRQYIMNYILPKYPQYNYFDIKETDGEISNIIIQELNKFIKENMKEIYESSKINKLTLPWRRMYEISLDAEYKGYYEI